MSTIEMVALVLGLACSAGIVLLLRRAIIVIWLVLHGERTQGWCARRQVISPTHVGGNHRTEFTFAFRTREGETTEFKDRPGAFGYEEGAPVRVCYDPARPHKRATIAGPDTWGPVYVRLLACLPLALISFVTLYALALNWGLLSA